MLELLRDRNTEKSRIHPKHPPFPLPKRGTSYRLRKGCNREVFFSRSGDFPPRRGRELCLPGIFRSSKPNTTGRFKGKGIGGPFQRRSIRRGRLIQEKSSPCFRQGKGVHHRTGFFTCIIKPAGKAEPGFTIQVRGYPFEPAVAGQGEFPLA